ncbi:MAG: HNH endonuclease [Terriglobales bacterium]
MAEDIRLMCDFFDRAETRLLQHRLGADGIVGILRLKCVVGERHHCGELPLQDERLEFAAHWHGEPGALVRELRELGFVAGEPGQYRIEGWEDEQTWQMERPERSAEGRAKARKSWGKAANDLTRSQRLTAAKKKGTHTDAEWAALLEVCEHRCVKCGKGGDLQGDHILPLYQDGSDSIDNIQPMDSKCNKAKHADTTDYRPKDWRERVEFLLRKRGFPENDCKNDCHGSGSLPQKAASAEVTNEEPVRGELRKGYSQDDCSQPIKTNTTTFERCEDDDETAAARKEFLDALRAFGQSKSMEPVPAPKRQPSRVVEMPAAPAQGVAR